MDNDIKSAIILFLNSLLNLIFSHHGLTKSIFLARAKATNGLGTTSGLVWKVLRGFENISRGASGENGR